MMDRVDLDEVLVGQGVLLFVYADGVVVHGVLWGGWRKVSLSGFKNRRVFSGHFRRP